MTSIERGRASTISGPSWESDDKVLLESLREVKAVAG